RDLSEDQYWQAAGALLAQEAAGDFNQAMMELGATVCLPGQPRCIACPVIQQCASRGAAAKREPEIRRKAVLKYSLCIKNNSVLLQQRAHSSSLMPGMWELPALAAKNKPAQPLMKLKHSITVTDYSVLVFAGKSDKGRWVPLNNVER